MPQKEIKPTKHTKLIAMLGGYALRPTWQVSALAANPDGKSFWALCGQDAMEWDVNTGEELSCIKVKDKSPIIKAPGQSLTLKPKESYTHEWSFPTKRGLLISENNTLIAYPKRPKSSAPLRSRVRAQAKQESIAPLWERTFEEGSDINGCDFLGGDRVVVSYGGFQDKSYFSRLACLSIETGAELWTFALDKEGLASTYTEGKFTYGSGSLGMPVCSADGSTIAILHHSKEEGRNITRALLFRPTGRLFRQIEVKGYGENSLLLAPDASWLVCCESSNHSFRIFDLPSGKERLLGDGHNARITGLGWLGDSKRLLSAAEDDPQVRLWDVERREATSIVEPESVHPLTLRALPDGFVAAFYERGIKAFDLLGNLRGALPVNDLNSKKSIEVSRDGEWVYWAGSGEARDKDFVFAWNLSELGPRWRFEVPKYHTITLSLSQDDNDLWVFEEARATKLNAKTGAVLSKSSLPYQYTYKDVSLLNDGETAVGIISWYDREMYEGEDYLRKWNCLSDKIEWSHEERELMSSELHVSRSGKWCIRRGYDSIIIHDLKDGSRLDKVSLEVIKDSPCFLALSPDETKLAVGTMRGMIFIFSLEGLPT